MSKQVQLVRCRDVVAANVDPRHHGEVFAVDHVRGEYHVQWMATGWVSHLPMGTVHLVERAGPQRPLMATDLLG